MKHKALILGIGIISIIALVIFVESVKLNSSSVGGVAPEANHTDTKNIDYIEREVDSSMMTLSMKEWVWVSTRYADGSSLGPKKPGAFLLVFKSDGSFSAKTDCNGIGGQYTIKDNALTFGAMMSTLMYCEGSQEQEFSSMLADVAMYRMTNKGELVLELKNDKGISTFR